MRVFRSTKDVLRRHAPCPRGGQVAPPHLGVFNHVPSDVGQLHGDAKVDGMCFGERVLNVQHPAHQEANRAGDLVGVLDEFLFITNQHVGALIVHQAFNQRANHVRWQGVVFNQIPELVEDRMVVPHPSFKIGLDDLEVCRSIRDVPVCHVVEDPTEGVQAGGVVANGGAKETARPKETLSAGRQHRLWIAEPQIDVLHVRECRLSEYNWLSFCE